MSGIFATNAPKYWEAGLPVIPLQPKTKKPVTEAWQRYAHEMVGELTQLEWVTRYPNGNMGLPMGEQSGLIAVDVDTDDEKVNQLLKVVLPKTPWVRRGKKGAVYIYRWNRHKTFRIRTMKGESLLEMLSSGTQIVLPPSIHPDTNMPYTANCELLDVLSAIPDLPVDIESRLRKGLAEAGYDLSTKGYTKFTEVISPGARDTKMTAIAGLMAKGVIRGERTLYEAVNEIVAWVNTFTEKVAGDSMDPNKAVNKLIEFLQKDIQVNGHSLPEGWANGMPAEEKAKYAQIFGAEAEAWGLQRILDHIQEGFEAHPGDMENLSIVVETAIKHAASNDKLTSMDCDVVVDFIANISAKRITRAAMRRRILELRKGPIPGETHTEVAQLVIDEMSRTGELRFHNGRIMQWKGCHWSPIEKPQLMSIIAKEFGSFPASKRQGDHEGVFKVLINLVPHGFASDTTRGLNFANGFLTTDLKMVPHNPEYGATYTMPFSYDPAKTAHCQRFLSFLYQCWGHTPDFADRVEALRQALGLTLFGLAPLYQRAFCLVGVPHSGKSVLMSIIQNLLPENSYCHVPPSNWSDKFMPTQMDGRAANFCGELSESDMIPGDVFKSIIDGEQMAGQFKGRDVFFFKPTCAHWFASNHLPRTRDSSAGFTRRWLFLHFDRAVPEQERIIGLANDIVAEEQAAIVAWAASSVPMVMANNGITIPASHRRLVQDMAGMNNSVRHFLTVGNLHFEDTREFQERRAAWQAEGEDVDAWTGDKIGEQELHVEYNVFCRENNARPVSLTVFRQRLGELQNEFGFVLANDSSNHGVLLGARLVARGT